MSKSGKILKDLRIKYNYSQEEVANKIGTTKMTISRYEAGKRKIGGENLVKLAKLFKVTPEYLLNGKEDSVSVIKTKDDLKKENMAFFETDDISKEDKEEIFRALQEFYFREKLKKEKWFLK